MTRADVETGTDPALSERSRSSSWIAIANREDVHALDRRETLGSMRRGRAVGDNAATEKSFSLLRWNPSTVGPRYWRQAERRQVVPELSRWRTMARSAVVSRAPRTLCRHGSGRDRPHRLHVARGAVTVNRARGRRQRRPSVVRRKTPSRELSGPAPSFRSMADPDRFRTYRAEHHLDTWLRATPVGTSIRFGAVVCTPEARQNFSSVTEVQDYVSEALARLRAKGGTHNRREDVYVRVRQHGGKATASYTWSGSSISMPSAPWAFTQTTVNHELAHHLSHGSGAAHGREFRDALVQLWSDIGSPEISRLLAESFTQAELSGAVEKATDPIYAVCELLRRTERSASSADRERLLTEARSRAGALEPPTYDGVVPELRFVRFGPLGARGVGRYGQLYRWIASHRGATMPISLYGGARPTQLPALVSSKLLDELAVQFVAIVIEMVTACEQHVSAIDPQLKAAVRRGFHASFSWAIHERITGYQPAHPPKEPAGYAAGLSVDRNLVEGT